MTTHDLLHCRTLCLEQRSAEIQRYRQDRCRHLLDDHCPADFLCLPLSQQREILERCLVDSTRPVIYSPYLDAGTEQALNPVASQGSLLRHAHHIGCKSSGRRIAKLANYIYYSGNCFRVNGEHLFEFLRQCLWEGGGLRELEVELWVDTLETLEEMEETGVYHAIRWLASVEGLNWTTFRLLSPTGGTDRNWRSATENWPRVVQRTRIILGPVIRQLMDRNPGRVAVELVSFEANMGRQSMLDVTTQWQSGLAPVAQPATPSPATIKIEPPATLEHTMRLHGKRKVENSLPSGLVPHKRRQTTHI